MHYQLRVNTAKVFFIDACTLHAIGEGILIAEVQKNSNTTYRVSDYGRLGADGKLRELHIDKALKVAKCEFPKIPYGNKAPNCWYDSWSFINSNDRLFLELKSILFLQLFQYFTIESGVVGIGKGKI